MKILSLLLMCVSTILLADDVFKHSAKEDKSGAFTEVSQKLSSIKKLKSNFRQVKKIQALKRPLISTGELIFSKKAGITWHLKTPIESTLIIDQEKIILMDDEKKKTIIQAKDKPMLYNFTKIFLSIFTGNTEELSQNFYIYFTGTTQDWRIGLIPKNSQLKKVIKHIILKGNNGVVASLLLQESNTDTTDIIFSK